MYLCRLGRNILSSSVYKLIGCTVVQIIGYLYGCGSGEEHLVTIFMNKMLSEHLNLRRMKQRKYVKILSFVIVT